MLIFNKLLLSFPKTATLSFSFKEGVRLFASSNKVSEDPRLTLTSESDVPISDIFSNPFKHEKKVCILCKYKIPVDYKNPKLLSQFVSPYTGYVYDKHITGLCDAQQNRMSLAINKSRRFGYMARIFKSPKYLKDPKLYDAFKPSRPHPY